MNGNPPPMTQAMSAALMAGAFAKWQQKYHPYPIHAPAFAQGAVPMSVARTRRLLNALQTDDEAAKHTQWCVDRMLGSCGHAQRKALSGNGAPEHISHADAIAQQGAQIGHDVLRWLDADLERDRLSWVDTDIEFDADTSTTTVTAWSVFTEVTRERANAFIELAKPKNWQAGSGLFKKSVPGTWHTATGTFTPAEPTGKQYDIFEHAEWSWTPETAGGFVNILSIDEFGSGPEDFEEMREDVLTRLGADILQTLGKETDGAEQAVRHVRETVRGRHAIQPEWSIDYGYKLHRSVQSRFIGGWRSGGLTKDDGTYEAAWFPTDGRDVGLLCIRVWKDLLFSRQADIFEDYSSLLNVMAPALGSLLLEQLAHDGIYKFLRETGNDHPATRA